ncbi:MAG: hypothetical protein MJY54_02020 [archaeon]|nr:hypothetical protein [archaeon]
MSDGPRIQKVSMESKPSAKDKNTGKEKSGTKEPQLKASNRDAIISISAIILLLACSVVIGNTIYDNTFVRHDSVIKYGDSVEIEYVGSLYNYYDRDGDSAIFDTNIMSVANDKNRTFIYEQFENFNNYNTFSNIRSIVIGNGELPAAFEDAIIGHRFGDTIEFSSADVYPLEGKVGYLKKSDEYSINKSKVFYSDSEFKAFFGVDAPETCFTIKSPYGWNAYAVRNFNNLIAVEYLPENSREYIGDTGVIYKVSKVADGKIVLRYDFPYNGKIIRAIGPYDEEMIYINEQISENEYKYKTEINTNNMAAGETSYFTIKVISPERCT